MFRIVFVCSGNICRSPLAEYVFRRFCEESGITAIEIASRGMGGWHAGDPADARTCQTAKRFGFCLDEHRAQKITYEDIGRFDLFVAMDRTHHRDLIALGVPKDKLVMLRDFDDLDVERDVPDPYSGGPDGFEEVQRIVERCSRVLIKALIEDGRLDLPS